MVECGHPTGDSISHPSIRLKPREAVSDHSPINLRLTILCPKLIICLSIPVLYMYSTCIVHVLFVRLSRHHRPRVKGSCSQPRKTSLVGHTAAGEPDATIVKGKIRTSQLERTISVYLYLGVIVDGDRASV
jgi:hypothetical protein